MASWQELRREAERVAARLVARGETVAVAESSAGGLIAAALLAVPGASAYFRGGAVVYTGEAKMVLLDRSRQAIGEPRAATEGHALVLAQAIRERLSADWGIGETGASGPTGNRYGDPPGHACVAVAGPPAPGGSTQVARATTVATGSDEREPNMYAFATAALALLSASLSP
ncbi:MAG TPA: CinA family protein, partial [Chloroflexota bacterium]|jgi:nicotinamide-nucleotide amidase|nr:CinA family protein [Chloroflexota bacterium]